MDMSQAKVDQYKKDKMNRKKNVQKDKVKRAFRRIADVYKRQTRDLAKVCGSYRIVWTARISTHSIRNSITDALGNAVIKTA